MPDFYAYLIPSLPMLHFGMKPPFTFDRFLEDCSRLIPEGDFLLLGNLPEAGETFIAGIKEPAIKGFISFDAALRNELVKLRSVRRHLDAHKYLRPDGYAGQEIAHIALAAQRNPSPLEAERYLDAERWRFLDALSFGHYFDLHTLIIYAYKLRILERWERIRVADKEALLEENLAVN